MADGCDSDDTYICHGCIGDAFLKQEVRRDGRKQECHFCGKNREAWPLDELAQRVQNVIEEHFRITPSDPSDEGLAYDKDMDWERRGDPVADVIAEIAGLEPEPAEAVRERLSQKTDYDAFDPFRSDTYYEEGRPDMHGFRESWEFFRQEIRTRSRFFGRYAQQALDQIFGDLASLKTWEGTPAIGVIYQSARQLWRWLVETLARPKASRSRNSTRRCPDCFELLPHCVRICPNCKAYQDWRRYIQFGQINLALLVALVSVSSAFVNSVIPLMKPRASEIGIIFESGTAEDVSFIGRNDGRSGGVIRLDNLWAYTGQNETNFWGLEVHHQGQFVEPDRERRMSVKIQFDDASRSFCRNLDQAGYFNKYGGKENATRLKTKDNGEARKRYVELVRGIRCTMEYFETSFHGESRLKEIELPCGRLPFVNDCLRVYTPPTLVTPPAPSP